MRRRPLARRRAFRYVNAIRDRRDIKRRFLFVGVVDGAVMS